MSFLFLSKDVCPFCGQVADGAYGLCRSCTDALEPVGACHSLPTTPPFYSFSAYFYNRFLRDHFSAFKFQRQTAYESVFCAMLSAYVRQHPLLSRLRWVSFIPQTHRNEVLRASNPAAAFAARLSGDLHIPLRPLLEKAGHRRAQKKAGALERIRNVEGAFCPLPDALRQPPSGVGILCDDFYTTGHTMQEGLSTLYANGLYAVGLTLACVRYPTPEEQERKDTPSKD